MSSGFMDAIRGLFGVKRDKGRPTESRGVPGTAVIGGFIQTREKSSDLIGPQRYRTFQDLMVNTSITAASVRYFLNLISRTRWKVEPADDSALAEEIAEKVEDAMNGMPTSWRRVVRNAAMYRFHGFSLLEWHAKRHEDGWLTMADIQARPQHTIEQWDQDDSGNVVGVVQRSPFTFEPIYLPRAKLIYMVDDALDDSPAGVGLLRHVAESSRALRRYMQLEGYGYETDLGGIPILKAPLAQLDKRVRDPDDTLTAAMRDAILEPLVDFATNHTRGPSLALLIDSLSYESHDGSPSAVPQYGADLLKAGSTAHGHMNTAIVRLQTDIARILGTESLLLGADGKGSLALSRVKTEALGLTCDGVNDDMADQFKKDFLEPLALINGWPKELLPTFRPDVTQLRDIEQVAGSLEAMARAGAVLGPNDPAINAVRQLQGLPDAPELTSERVDELDELGLGPDGKPIPPPPVLAGPDGKPAPGAKGPKAPGKGAPAPKAKPTAKARLAKLEAVLDELILESEEEV